MPRSLEDSSCQQVTWSQVSRAKCVISVAALLGMEHGMSKHKGSSYTSLSNATDIHAAFNTHRGSTITSDTPSWLSTAQWFRQKRTPCLHVRMLESAKPVLWLPQEPEVHERHRVEHYPDTQNATPCRFSCRLMADTHQPAPNPLQLLVLAWYVPPDDGQIPQVR